MVRSEDVTKGIAREFGARIEQLREEQHLSVGNAAAMIGVHESRLYAWERGTGTPTFSNIVALARLYKVDEAVLFFFLRIGRHRLWETIRKVPASQLDELQAVVDDYVKRKGAASSRAQRKS